MKKFIIVLIVFAILSLAGGYFGASIFSNKGKNDIAQKPQTSEEKEQIMSQRDIAKEKEVIKNLVKTYLYASTNYEWDIVSSITTGQYRKQLQEVIIPNSEKLKEKNVKFVFNPKSFNVTIETINSSEAIVVVDYIINRGEGDTMISVQEKLKMYLVYQNNKWLIFSVEML